MLVGNTFSSLSFKGLGSGKATATAQKPKLPTSMPGMSHVANPMSEKATDKAEPQVEPTQTDASRKDRLAAMLEAKSVQAFTESQSQPEEGTTSRPKIELQSARKNVSPA